MRTLLLADTIKTYIFLTIAFLGSQTSYNMI